MGNFDYLSEVVADIEHRHPGFFGEGTEPRQHGVASLPVERGKGLIEQEHEGVGEERPRQRDTLALSPRQSPWGPLQLRREPEPFHDVGEREGPVPLCGGGAPFRITEVPFYREVLEERRFLKGEADPPAMRRHEDPAAVVLPDRCARPQPSSQPGEAGHRAQDGGLAAAGRPEDRGHFAGRCGKRGLDFEGSDRAAERQLDGSGRSGSGSVHRALPPARFCRLRVSATTTKENASSPPERRWAVPHSMSSTWS